MQRPRAHVRVLDCGVPVGWSGAGVHKGEQFEVVCPCTWRNDPHHLMYAKWSSQEAVSLPPVLPAPCEMHEPNIVNSMHERQALPTYDYCVDDGSHSPVLFRPKYIVIAKEAPVQKYRNCCGEISPAFEWVGVLSNEIKAIYQRSLRREHMIDTPARTPKSHKAGSSASSPPDTRWGSDAADENQYN